MASEKKIYISIPPELNDGEHWCPLSLDELGAIPTLLKEFAANWTIENVESEIADELTFKLCVMTDAEFEAIPEI